MAYDQTLIANLAMGHLGDREIENIDSTTDRDAKVLKRFYTHAVHRTYEAHDWLWARDEVELARKNETPVTRYIYSYALPSHFRRVSNLSEYSDMRVALDAWMLRTREIHTDAEHVFLEFVSSEWSEAVWPAYFADCVSVQLAMLAIMQLSHGKDVKQMLNQMFQRETLPYARSVDGQGQPSRQRFIRSPWTQTRMGGRMSSNLRRNV